MRPRESRDNEHHCGVLRQAGVAEQVRANLLLILRSEPDPRISLTRGLPRSNCRAPENAHAKVDNLLDLHPRDTCGVEDGVLLVSVNRRCPLQQLAKPEPVTSPIAMPHHPVFTVLIESLFALRAEQVLRCLE